MSANLYPGIKSLHLVLDTPYDLIRTDDVRDDLVGVKVWYSTTQGFDPNNSQGTLAFNGLSQSITISDLEVSTRYYVRFAFISAIDPNTFTISPELTAEVYDENVTVFGYLTNDPTAIATNADGSGGNYALTQGVFKVYNLSQDVTGAGPVYGIVPNTTFGGLVGTIDPVTGIYSASALSEDAGNVTFYATYNNVTVIKVWNLLKSSAGSDAPSLRIKSTGNAFVYQDENASTTTSGVSISTSLQNLTGIPVYSAAAYTIAGVLLGPIEFNTYPDGVSISINAAQFNPSAYNNIVAYVVVTSTLGSASDSISLYRINNGTEQITVEQSNQAHTITAFADGTVADVDYLGSGNIIKVKQGNTYLPLDNNSPYTPGTWRLVTIADTGIVADPTPTIGSDYINFDQHSAMTADVAYIDYQIVGTSTTGKAFDITIRQSFSKSKAGVRGSSAPVVSLTASTQIFTVAKNTGTITPADAVFTASVVNVTNPVYVWTVDDVVQASTSSTLTVSSFTGTPKIVKVVVTGDNSVNVFDQATLFSLREGDDSLQAGLANENQTISCDPTGEPIAGQFPLSSQLVVARGAAILTTSVVYSKVSETGMSSTINTSTGVITINSVSADFGSATYRATVGTATLDKVFNFNKSKNGANGADGADGADGVAGPSIEISGLGTFYKNSGGAISPTTRTLQAVVLNVTSPSYSWTISGATPNSATGTSVTITPTGVGENIVVTLTVTGSNLPSATTITRAVSLVSQGAVGQAGQNGIMSAYPSIYQWTSGAEPARPSTSSTYIWSNGSYTAPSGWSSVTPANTSAGWVLWEITVPLTVEATTTSSTLAWSNTSYAIRAIASNGSNGANGANGAAGSNGSDGTPGSATYLINRGGGSSSSQPTGPEVLTATGYRYAQQGDIATISYNNGSNSVAYRAISSGYSASWSLQTSYITGSLIVQNSISGDRIIANSMSVDKLTSGTSNVGYGQFGLGGTETLSGFTGIGRFKRTSLGPGEYAGFATITFNEVTSDTAGSIAGCHVGPGWGVIAYNASNTNYNSFSTTTGMASKTEALIAKSNRSVGSPGNVNLLPKSSLTAGAANFGAYVSYYGESAYNRISEAILGSGPAIGGGPHAGYFLCWGDYGVSTPKQVFLANKTYSIQVSVGGGRVFIGDGVAPFTGAHDGIMPITDLPEIGDIVVDYKVLEHIDISNSIVEYKTSNTSNQRGVIGVCATIHDTPPPDWSTDPLTIPAHVDITRNSLGVVNQLPDTIIETTGGYNIPDGYKVVFVNALGEGQVNVCGEAGNIDIGDLIVTSSIPGKGMRQSDDIVRSYTVAKARESVEFDSPSQVKMISCIYLCG